MKKTTNNKKYCERALSFTLAAMNATNVILPIARPYINIAQVAQQENTKISIAQAALAGLNVGEQMVDNLLFSKAEAFTSPVTSAVVVGETVEFGEQLILNAGTATRGTLGDSGVQTISSGGSANSTTIDYGGVQTLRNGASATSTTINSQGYQYISSGGFAEHTVINSNGSQWISGGTASNTTVNSGGVQVISSGGKSLDVNQAIGGNVNVYVSAADAVTQVVGSNQLGSFSLSNGTAGNFVINGGGSQTVLSGGVALNTTLSGGVQSVAYGGTSLNVVQNSGGDVVGTVSKGDSRTIIVGTNGGKVFSLSNGTATNFTFYNFGHVIQGGTAISTTLYGGGEMITSGGTAIYTLLNSSAAQHVSSTGIAISTIVNSDSWLNVASGGTALDIVQNVGGNTNATVKGGDTVTLISGRNESGSFYLSNGVASNFVLNSVGSQTISAGGTAIATTINSVGWQTVANGGLAVDVTVNSAGAQQVYGGTASNTTVNSRGEQIVDRGIAVSTKINNGGVQFVAMNGAGSVTAVSTTINAGGQSYVYNQGVTSDTTLNTSGTLYLYRGAAASGYLQNKGYLDITQSSDGNTIGSLGGTGGRVLFDINPYTPVPYPRPIPTTYRKVLTMAALDGSQTFEISSDLRNNIADNIVVNGNTSGTHYIKVTKEASVGGSLASLRGPATVAEVLGVDTSLFLGTQSSIDGVKIIPNIVHNGNLWQIENYTVLGDSDLAKVAAAGADMSYAALYNSDKTLQIRMGDLQAGLKESGLWGKLSGGELSINDNSMKHTMIQGGYDKVRKLSNGQTVTGIMLEHLDGSIGYQANGSGKLKNTRVGIYHTWLGNSGHYYDIVLKSGRMRNELTVHADSNIQGNYNAWNTSLSFEYGYKKQIKQGIYITPLAKLSLGRINSASYTTDSNTLVRQDAINSVLGRVGVGIGQSTERSKWYLNAAAVHEFTAGSKVRTGEGIFASTAETNLKGTALELSLGTSVQIGKGGLLYTDISKSFGGKVANKWNLQLGYRANF